MSEDRDALEELRRVSQPGQTHVMLHYIYLQDKNSAPDIISELQRRGFKTEDRLGADGSSWLVLARLKVVPNEALISQTRELMESLAASVNGEYDGWEVEVEN